MEGCSENGCMNLSRGIFANTVMDGIETVIQGAGAAFGVVAMDQRPADLLSNDIVLHANILRAAVEHSAQKSSAASTSSSTGTGISTSCRSIR